jgi:hypothetical protein
MWKLRPSGSIIFQTPIIWYLVWHENNNNNNNNNKTLLGWIFQEKEKIQPKFILTSISKSIVNLWLLLLVGRWYTSFSLVFVQKIYEPLRKEMLTLCLSVWRNWQICG